MLTCKCRIEPPPPGDPIYGKEIIYNIDNNSSKNAKELEVSAITLYSSEYVYQPGKLIAVNDNFICYIVKGKSFHNIVSQTYLIFLQVLWFKLLIKNLGHVVY